MEATHQAMASTLEVLTQQHRLVHKEARERALEAKAPKSLSDILGPEATQTLMAVCHAEEESELPPFWKQLAVAGLKRDRLTLQEALRAKGRARGVVAGVPIATPNLIKKITGLHWAGLNIDDLSEGLQPFVIVLLDNANADVGVEAQRRADTYDIILQEGSTSTSYQDAQALKVSKAVIPRDVNDACAQLLATLLLWAVLVGDNHPFVYALGTLVNHFGDGEQRFRHLLQALPTEVPPGALVLRFVQIKIVNCWREALQTRALPDPPKFSSKVLSKLLEKDMSWIRPVPTQYWKPVARTVTTGSLSQGGSNASRNSEGSGVSSLGTPTALGTNPSRGSDNRGQSQAKNPSISRVFEAFRDKIKSMTLKEAINRGGSPPTVEHNGAKTPMCLAYHLKG